MYRYNGDSFELSEIGTFAESVKSKCEDTKIKLAIMRSSAKGQLVDGTVGIYNIVHQMEIAEKAVCANCKKRRVNLDNFIDRCGVVGEMVKETL